jgi:hypothetical protein
MTELEKAKVETEELSQLEDRRLDVSDAKTVRDVHARALRGVVSEQWRLDAMDEAKPTLPPISLCASMRSAH